MPLSQEDIRKHYEGYWNPGGNDEQLQTNLVYSNPVEDAIMYPIYQQMIRDLQIKADGGKILDIGCGSGRWIRFFLDHFKPQQMLGVDYTAASIKLIEAWKQQLQDVQTQLDFQVADITDPNLQLDPPYDLINIANVLFHIPENDKYMASMQNLSKLVAPNGHIVTTEYLPRVSMRTEWMQVRSRYEYEAICQAVGLRIVDIRAIGFFANDPMGVDGTDQGVRGKFHQVRAGITSFRQLSDGKEFQASAITFLSHIEQALLDFCKERIADIDMPTQKLVVLAKV